MLFFIVHSRSLNLSNEVRGKLQQARPASVSRSCNMLLFSINSNCCCCDLLYWLLLDVISIVVVILSSFYKSIRPAMAEFSFLSSFLNFSFTVLHSLIPWTLFFIVIASLLHSSHPRCRWPPRHAWRASLRLLSCTSCASSNAVTTNTPISCRRKTCHLICESPLASPLRVAHMQVYCRYVLLDFRPYLL